MLALDERRLRAIGFSRQKAGYTRDLAQAVVGGSLDVEALAALSDDGVRAVLTGLRGIGPWTADVYLTMALRRPDAFPQGDLALLASAQRVKRTRRAAEPARAGAARRGVAPASRHRGADPLARVPERALEAVTR